MRIPKSHSSTLRPLSIPSMRDRAIQALYLLALDPIAETTVDRHSYGFRTERCTADTVEQCRIMLSRKKAAPWIFEGDIQSYLVVFLDATKPKLLALRRHRDKVPQPLRKLGWSVPRPLDVGNP